MDKYEYRAKTEEMLSLVRDGELSKAEAIADSIDWRRVRSVSMLSSVSAIYEEQKRYSDAREILYIAYDRARNSKKTLYKLTELAIKSGDLEDASDCYHEYASIADRDPNKFVLEYKLAKAKDESISKQIEILEKLKDQEYTEPWAYELARLYNEAGMSEKCVEECDDISLWFTDGEYVKKALKLKEQYKQLTPSQQEVLDADTYEEKEVSEIRRAAGMLLASELRARAVEDERDANGLFGKGRGLLGEVFAPKEEDSNDVASSSKRAKDESTPQHDRSMEDTMRLAVAGLDNTVIPGVSIADSLDMDIEGLKGESDEFTSMQQQAIEESKAEEELKELANDNLGEEITDEAIQEPEDVAEDLVLEEKDDEPSLEEDEEETPKAKRFGLGAFFLGKKDPFYEDDEDDIEEQYELNFDPEPASDEYIAENVEYQPGEIGEDVPYEAIDEEEAIQIEAPVYNPSDDKEIQEVIKDLEGDERVENGSLLDDVSKAKLEAKLESESKVADTENAENRLYDTLDLQGEIMAGLAMINKDEKENTRESGNAMDAIAFDEDEAEMTEIDAEVEKEHSVMDEVAESLAETVEDVAAEKKGEEELDFEEEQQVEKIENEQNEENEGRFVMRERYSLDSQSHIGKAAGLSQYERDVFSYFVPVRGMSEQIVNALDALKNAQRNGTSATGNLLITGEKGTGKSKLAIGVIKSLQKQSKKGKGKVAVVNGGALNGKNIDVVFQKVYGGALLIERAGELEKRTIKSFVKAMEKDTGELLIILEDSKENLAKIVSLDKNFASMFSARLNVPKFVNDELVTFAQTYAKENGYRVQEMAILAIYNRIDMMQREDHDVTVAEVAKIMDEAFEKSKKNSLKRTMTTLFRSQGDDKSLTLLMEEDFE